MTCDLREICLAALQPERLAGFWAALLDREPGEPGQSDGAVLAPGADGGAQLRFLPTTTPRSGLGRMHLDLTSASLDDQRATVERALAHGAGHLDVGQGPDSDHVVLADPEGNEFCVIEPGNRFLDGCGRIGALCSDGLADVGYFWSRALGWPLVWDQDGETAIQSPSGGSKISWGGPPVAPKHGPNRWHLHVGPGERDVADAEVRRLVGLGATFLGADPATGIVALADPGGNELCVLPA